VLRQPHQVDEVRVSHAFGGLLPRDLFYAACRRRSATAFG
jgi:hypothetical protein